MVGSVYSSITRVLSRRLVEISKTSSDSLSRLSTGKRILRPSDDPANFSLLTGIESQVRGLRQASLNINQIQGLTATADSALSSLSDIALKLKDLALEAADSSLSTSDRSLLSEEASELLAEFNQIAQGTSFGDRKLLTGSISDMYVQTGANSGNGFSFSIGDARSTSLGKIAVYSGAQGSLLAGIGSSSTTTLSLNGTSIGASVDDGVSTDNADSSALAIANAINAKSSVTGVFAEAISTERTLYIDAYQDGGHTFDSGDFVLNGVSITGSIENNSDLIDAINSKSSSTGVTAEIDGDGNIFLSTVDGRNLQVSISNSSGNDVYLIFNLTQNEEFFALSGGELSAGGAATHAGAIEIYSSKAILIGGGSQVSQAIGLSDGLKGLVAGTSTANINLSTADDADRAIKILDATLEDISALRAEVGAVHSRLNISSAYVLNQQFELEDAQERIGGVDVAMEIATLAMQQMLQDATLTAMTQANVSYSSVSRLLEGLRR